MLLHLTYVIFQYFYTLLYQKKTVLQYNEVIFFFNSAIVIFMIHVTAVFSSKGLWNCALVTVCFKDLLSKKEMKLLL